MIMMPGDKVKAKAGGTYEKCHDGQDAVFLIVDDGDVAMKCVRCGDEFSAKEYKSWGCRFEKVV